MGGVARVLNFVRAIIGSVKTSETEIDSGGLQATTSTHFSDCGDDSAPLSTDYAVFVEIPRTGERVVVGYLDPNSDQKVQAGEKRIYGRDDQGDTVCELWMKGDGSVVIDNYSGRFELETSGDFDINGVKITNDGDVVTSDGVSLRNHPHNQGNDSDGDAEVPTDPPTATE